MKNFTSYLTVFLLFFSLNTFAQNNKSGATKFFSGWNFAATAGVNFSAMFGDVANDTNTAFLIFANAGLVIDKEHNEEWILGFEPHFSGEGQTYSSGYERVLYLNLPFLGKYRVAKKLTLDGGIHVGVKILERRKTEDSGSESNNRFSRVAPGFTVGSTYNLDQDWFVQFRTHYKISDVIRKDAGDTEGSSILTLQLSVGRRF